jgi:hypothetical protein
VQRRERAGIRHEVRNDVFGCCSSGVRHFSYPYAS